MYTQEEQQQIIDDMSASIYNKERTYTEDELGKDAVWIEASKAVYKHFNGSDYVGTPEELAKEGLNIMGEFNYNMTFGTAAQTVKIQDADDYTKTAFYYMMDTYDKKDVSSAGVGRAFKEMALDPLNYAMVIGTAGVGFFGKQAAGSAAKGVLKEGLKQSAIRYMTNPVAGGAVEGAAYTVVDDAARQDAKIGAGYQEGYDPVQGAVAGVVGAGVGGGLVKATDVAVKGIGKGINKVIESGEEEMMKAAGGGTPPVIDEKDLIIQHNLSEKNLAYASDKGLTVPSLAITNKGTPLEGFGEITMLGDEALATPSKDHKVFGADIYSPRHPRAIVDYKPADIRKMDKDLEPYSKDLDGYSDIRTSSDVSNLKDNLALKMKFLNDTKGYDIKLPTLNEADENLISKTFPDEYKKSIENKGINVDTLINDENFKHKVIEDFKKTLDLVDGNHDKFDTFSPEQIDRIVKYKADNINNIGRNSGKLDFVKLRQTVADEVNKYGNEFDDYVNNFTSQFESISYFYDNNTKKAFNEANVIKVMTKNLRGGEGWNYGSGNVRAKVTPEFKTIDQIKKAKDRLVSREDFEKIKESVNDDLLNIAASIRNPNERNSFIANDRAMEFIQDYATKGKKAEQDYSIKPTPEQYKQIDGFLAKLQEMPTEYFESKVLRKMELGEFKIAVIPANASDKTKQILDKNGIEYTTYDPNLPGDRVKQIQKTAEEKGYLFSLPASLGLAAMSEDGETNDTKQ